MLTELIIFAMVLVVLQALMTIGIGYIVLKSVMSKRFIRHYMNIVMDVTSEFTEKMIEKEERDL